MAFDHGLTVLAAEQEDRRRDVAARLARRIRIVDEWDKVRAYRKLFLGEDGQLKPEAVKVLADIGAVARIGMVERPGASDAELREFAGRRQLALHVLGRMDQSGVRMRDLAAKLREVESE